MLKAADITKYNLCPPIVLLSNFSVRFLDCSNPVGVSFLQQSSTRIVLLNSKAGRF